MNENQLRAMVVHAMVTARHLLKEAWYDLLVINDSDVRVEKDYLRDVVAPFADPKVGVILKAADEDA